MLDRTSIGETKTMGLLKPGKEWKYVMKETRKRDVSLVKKAIIDKYGFEPSEVYCSDLISFVEVMTGPVEEEQNV